MVRSSFVLVVQWVCAVLNRKWAARPLAWVETMKVLSSILSSMTIYSIMSSVIFCDVV